jgi:nucleoid DNA-binding protein
MAHKMKVLQALRPRIIFGDNADMGEAVNYIADRTGANEGEANLMLKEVRDTIIFFNRSGRAVVIEGLGTFRPNVKMDGSYNIIFKMDKVLKNRLNTPGEDKMRIVNKDNIGKSIDEIYAIWNEANPDDPVEL